MLGSLLVLDELVGVGPALWGPSQCVSHRLVVVDVHPFSVDSSWVNECVRDDDDIVHYCLRDCTVGDAVHDSFCGAVGGLAMWAALVFYAWPRRLRKQNMN